MDLQSSDDLPNGYGFNVGEPGYGQYDAVEILRTGKKKSNGDRIFLPQSVWFSRIVLWVQAIELLYTII